MGQFPRDAIYVALMFEADIIYILSNTFETL